MTIGAEQGKIAEVGSPVLILGDAIDAARPLCWTSTAVAIASALLALANAPTIGGWFDELTSTPLTETLRAPIDWWGRTTAAWRLDVPRGAIRARWKAAQATRFGREQPGEQGAGDAP